MLQPTKAHRNILCAFHYLSTKLSILSIGLLKQIYKLTQTQSLKYLILVSSKNTHWKNTHWKNTHFSERKRRMLWKKLFFFKSKHDKKP